MPFLDVKSIKCNWIQKSTILYDVIIQIDYTHLAWKNVSYKDYTNTDFEIFLNLSNTPLLMSLILTTADLLNKVIISIVKYYF